MSIKKKDLAQINQAITKLLEEGQVKSKGLVYALVKNIKKLEPEVEALQKAFQTDSEDFKKYVEETRAVYTEYVDTDEQGNFKTVANGVILKREEDKETVGKLITEIDEKYSEAIKERNEELKKYQELLEEDSDVDFIKFKLADFPDEVAPGLIYVLDELIEA